jgi:4a-hydroxytetrahydrobiopterin dehydratase
MPVPPPLTPDEVRARLAELEGWEGDTTGISRTFGIEYHAGIRLVVDVAKAAKEQMHHPDIDIRWDTIRFFITTHDAGYVVTDLDFTLAQTINDLAATHGAVSI